MSPQSEQMKVFVVGTPAPQYIRAIIDEAALCANTGQPLTHHSREREGG